MGDKLLQVYNFLFLIFLCILNIKYNILYYPSVKEIIEYQFNFFTTITVLAGFSFTALGILISLSGNIVIEKLKDTSIVHKLYLNILNSILFLICSSIISLLFILGIINIVKMEIVKKCLYSIECGFMVLGILYFVYALLILLKILKKLFPNGKLKNNMLMQNYNREKAKVQKMRQKIENSKKN